jgi:hypothetical protein
LQGPFWGLCLCPRKLRFPTAGAGLGLLFEHWLKIKNRAALAVKREAGPRTDKEFKQKRLAI